MLDVKQGDQVCHVLDKYSQQILHRCMSFGEAMAWIDRLVLTDPEDVRDDGVTVVCAASEIRRWIGEDRTCCLEWDARCVTSQGEQGA